ncbi:acyclic terpene utilization AtuA family protein [Clostridium polynesiense]|uniref:acyclic terpene utilization AtuA family protein n=1 Tax=Clostridium polynesiense TaxID=1325933 RepID=UPI000ACFD84F|nr:acyclic terpene utilization AtuA family protein [Clostridium polynesiense]
MNKQIKIFSPCGILGYGFPIESFENGLRDKPHAIVVDAGSTDAGPHKLGAGVSIVSRMACKKDLLLLIKGSRKLNIPLIIGSAGGSGARVHTDWTLDIINEILREEKINIKMAVIWADIEKERVKRANKSGEILDMGSNIPKLNDEIINETNSIVAQMGIEPIIEALEKKSEIILCGRAYDPAPFAAVGIFNGFDPALSFHLGKILECGALCAEPGTTKDCIMGVIEEDSFYVYPTNTGRKCTTTSVAAHTFYEKDHPYILKGPGIELNLKDCDFQAVDERTVRVKNSKIINTPEYYIKLEGARKVLYRTFVVAGIRDPLLINKVEKIEAMVVNGVKEYFSEIPSEDYRINFINYGLNGVMGELEPSKEIPKEVGVLFEVLAKTQELASAICSAVRSSFMHYGYEGRKSTSGNLAFPFSPSDIDFGPVYEFSVYHLMKVKNGREVFPIEYMEVNNG